MEVTEGAINCKLQVVGVGTSSREEGGNLEVAVESDFFFYVSLHAELLSKFQFAELLRI